MTQEKRFAVAVMLVLMAGLTQALPTRAQGSSWESSSKKGKAKDSGIMLAKETGPAPAAASVPLVNPDEYILGESDVVQISVWKEHELAHLVVVGPGGKLP